MVLAICVEFSQVRTVWSPMNGLVWVNRLVVVVMVEWFDPRVTVFVSDEGFCHG